MLLPVETPIKVLAVTGRWNPSLSTGSVFIVGLKRLQSTEKPY
jgi:hypothetical protein